MKTIAIIPARGGSKGIKYKNIRDVCGKPLIYYQLKNALDLDLMDEVVLVSDSDRILEVSKELFGKRITTIKRPKEISTDTSKTEETLLFVLNQLQESYDVVVTLEPTNPLNRPEYIKRCIQVLYGDYYNASCCVVDDNSFHLNSGGDLKLAMLRPMKDCVPLKIRECGNCWATKVDVLRESKNRLGSNLYHIHVPIKDAYHLDSETDWLIIEALMRQRLLREPERYYKTKAERTDEDLYDQRYWKKVIDPDGNERDKTQEQLKRIAFCREEIDYINNLEPGKVLDVGCGLGFILSAIDSKWEKHGVEISEFGANYAKQFGNVLCGILKGAQYESNSFDVVLLNHVIEHMINPIDELIEIRRILKPGGKLVVGTPDFECGVAKRYGDNFRLLNDEGHISLFSTFSLYRLLTDLFFEVENISYPFFQTEYFTEENLMRLFNTSKMSPPFYGNVVTFYAYKK